MKISYTKHALWRMRKRHITKSMVEIAIKNPDRTGKGYTEKELAFKKFNKGQIKIVYMMKQTIPHVVTAMWTKGGF